MVVGCNKVWNNELFFIMADKNKPFSIPAPSHRSSGGGAETINGLQKLKDLRPQNDFDLSVRDVEKIGLEQLLNFP